MAMQSSVVLFIIGALLLWRQTPAATLSFYKGFKKPWLASNYELKITRRGYRLGLKECQRQFVWNRWNCPVSRDLLSSKLPPPLTKHYPYNTRESAFIHAIVAAGMAFEMIKSCYLGNNLGCPCPPSSVGNETDYRRRLCQDNLDYALKQTRRISRKLQVNSIPMPRNILNWSNNRRGIKAVFEQLPTVCRCGGATGSCATKTCWKTLPRFETVGEELKMLYQKAVRVSPSVDRTAQVKGLSRTHLIYIDESPNYCGANSITGRRGTLNRHCNRNDIQTCNNLCETCGYRTRHEHEVKQDAKCKCQFQWCCKVVCQSCPRKVPRSYCSL